MVASNHVLAPQFDRILSGIEAGQIAPNISHLAGLLDAVLIDCGDPAAVRRTLQAHPLGALLRAPAMAETLRGLGVETAIATRDALASDTLDQAMRRGDRCFVFSDHWQESAGGPFDLVLAPRLLDRCDGAGLGPILAALSRLLVPGGRLALSFFVPGHLGCGWQTLWLGQAIHRHAPKAVSAAAREAGLAPRLFHDASDSLIWAELRRNRQNHDEGDRS